MWRWLLLGAGIAGAVAVLGSMSEPDTIAGMPSDDFVRLLALSGFLVLIGSGLLSSYGGKLGQGVKELAVWVAIALALVAGYSYRTELAAIGQRVTGELAPPGEAVVIDGRTSGEKAVKIRRRADGHFVARAQVNGATMSMLVDTGASTIVLKATDARQIGIDVDRLSFSIPVQTANGTAYAAAVRIRQISVGPITLEGVDALVSKPGALKESLLGMNFLRRLRSYEFSGDFLTLRG